MQAIFGSNLAKNINCYLSEKISLFVWDNFFFFPFPLARPPVESVLNFKDMFSHTVLLNNCGLDTWSFCCKISLIFDWSIFLAICQRFKQKDPGTLQYQGATWEDTKRFLFAKEYIFWISNISKLPWKRMQGTRAAKMRGCQQPRLWSPMQLLFQEQCCAWHSVSLVVDR